MKHGRQCLLTKFFNAIPLVAKENRSTNPVENLFFPR